MPDIRVPAMGESVVEASVARWLKGEGEPVAVGEPLVELETEKVNTEVAADQAGTLERILQPEGATVQPGDVLGTIATAAPAQSAPPPSPAAQDVQSPPARPEPVERQAAEPTTSGDGADRDRRRASPVAQRVADDLGVDLARVPGTGPGGRVTREDVMAYTQQQAQSGGPSGAARPALEPQSPPGPSGGQTAAVGGPPPRPETRQRLSRRRLTIARRLVEAQRTAAMLTTFNEVDMSAIMELRRRRREAFRQQHGVDLGYMSFFTKATVGALKAFPQLNAELDGEELVLKHYYDIGIAIGDPEGLVVPVLRDADKHTFAEIERAIAAFAQKARDRALTLEDLTGGTFTITNGGVFGSLLSTPILNPPQVGILGMHKIEQRPVVVEGQVAIRPMMYLALSYDHRVVDGREAVQFLVRLKELLEDPERLLLEG
jgi:2-oxoglutarate dehydrogenase E2 component (dihydrolipoamide succinyltransferase)